jgi:hypothetical protein
MDRTQQHEIVELTDLEHVQGGAAQCTYESKTYSEGATIKNSAGEIQTCTVAGTWR